MIRVRPLTGRSARRLTLLASAAGLAIAVAATGPISYGALGVPSLITPAHAAGVAQSPAGFADIVAKVKSAVISVRVKIDNAAKLTSMEEKGANPSRPGFPFEKFFKQFGFPAMPNGLPQGSQMVTDEGSGFFISADGYAVTNNHVSFKIP